MRRMAEHYEVRHLFVSLVYSDFPTQLLIYTASLSKYADPLLDILDPDNVSAAAAPGSDVSNG